MDPAFAASIGMSGSTESILRKTSLFESLTDDEMQALAARAMRKRFQKDQQLFAEGDPCTGLYLVAAGKIRIFKLVLGTRTNTSGRGPR
jgi:CRP/FNR family transcriptional regulator